KVAEGCYTFHPLGVDAPLFNSPQTEGELTQIADPVNVPEPLRRLPLYADLEAVRQAIADGMSRDEAIAHSIYFNPQQAILQVWRTSSGTSAQIPAEEILICDLSGPPPSADDFWRRPPADRQYRPAHPHDDAPATVALPIQVAVDPALGRL